MSYASRQVSGYALVCFVVLKRAAVADGESEANVFMPIGRCGAEGNRQDRSGSTGWYDMMLKRR